MKIRKLLAVLLCTAMFAGVFAGCGNKKEEGGKDTEFTMCIGNSNTTSGFSLIRRLII